jgi:hypothetical protein
MKKYPLIFIRLSCAFILFWAGCSSNPAQNKLKGNWKSKDSSATLKVTDKVFNMDGEEEDYFTQGDTVFTSYQGNKPYTIFLVQKLDDHYLKLMGPDSIAVEYSR